MTNPKVEAYREELRKEIQPILEEAKQELFRLSYIPGIVIKLTPEGTLVYQGEDIVWVVPTRKGLEALICYNVQFVKDIKNCPSLRELVQLSYYPSLLPAREEARKVQQQKKEEADALELQIAELMNKRSALLAEARKPLPAYNID